MFAVKSVRLNFVAKSKYISFSLNTAIHTNQIQKRNILSVSFSTHLSLRI